VLDCLPVQHFDSRLQEQVLLFCASSREPMAPNQHQTGGS